MSRKLVRRRQALREQLRDARSHVRSLHIELSGLDAALAGVPSAAEPFVTEHAIVRYLERVVGLDLDEVRRRILDGGRGELVRRFRSGKFPIGGGAKIVAQGGVVVTVIAKEKA